MPDGFELGRYAPSAPRAGWRAGAGTSSRSSPGVDLRVRSAPRARRSDTTSYSRGMTPRPPPQAGRGPPGRRNAHGAPSQFTATICPSSPMMKPPRRNDGRWDFNVTYRCTTAALRYKTSVLRPELRDMRVHGRHACRAPARRVRQRPRRARRHQPDAPSGRTRSRASPSPRIPGARTAGGPG